MADNTARRRKAETWRAEAGLQPLQLAVVHEEKVPLPASHVVLMLAQDKAPAAVVQPEAAVTPFSTHL